MMLVVAILLFFLVCARTHTIRRLKRELTIAYTDVNVLSREVEIAQEDRDRWRGSWKNVCDLRDIYRARLTRSQLISADCEFLSRRRG